MKLNVSLNEAAKMLGIRSASLQTLVKEGKIPAWKEGRNWKIPVKALEEWNEERAAKEAERRKYDTAR